MKVLMGRGADDMDDKSARRDWSSGKVNTIMRYQKF